MTRPRSASGTFLPESLSERFWSTVGPRMVDRCWEWLGRRDEKGYGRISSGRRRNVGAHRISWELSRGDVPVGQCVLHRCDNPGCVNPAHLFLGSVADNNRDRALKGRSADVRGVKSPKAKLSPAQVIEIRSRRAAGESIVSLGLAFGVHHGTISRIAKNQTWSAA